MMLCKEELKCLEMIASRQDRIHDADYGVFLSDFDLTLIREAVKELKLCYGGKVWVCNTHNLQQSAVQDIHFLYEIDHATGMARGVKINVTISKELKTKNPGLRKWARIYIRAFHKPVSEVPVLLRDEMDQS